MIKTVSESNITSAKFRRVCACIFFIVGLGTCALAAESGFLGLYMMNQKMGYVSFSETRTVLNGLPVKESSSTTLVSGTVMGNSMKVKISGKTFSRFGRPVEIDYVMSSNGVDQDVIAKFSGKICRVEINNAGTKTNKTIPLPKGIITDDPLSGVVLQGDNQSKPKTIFVFDPNTATFVKTQVKVNGTKLIDSDENKVRCDWVQIIDPRSTEDVYLQKGQLVRIDGPFGMQMIPESKAKALSGFGNSKVDLAIGSRIVPELPEGANVDWEHLKSLKAELTTTSVLSLKELPGQTVTESNGVNMISVQPEEVKLPSGYSIEAVGKLEPQWTKSDTDIPSGEAKFKKLVRSIIGNTTDVGLAARKIQVWVLNIMTPDASVGVLRNANDVLATKRGVCRDYAILTATLCRAAGIPAKLATGIVSWDGNFYYHAWVYYYNGKTWIGLDSTAPDAQMCASHIALAWGSLSEAFQTPFLNDPKLKIISLN